MPSLLERIQQLKGQEPQPQQAGIENILAQKTGKARRRRGPTQTALAESQAITTGRQALREQTMAERLADLQLRGAEEIQAEEQATRESALQQQERMQQQQLQAETTMRRAEMEAAEEQALTGIQRQQERKIKQMNNVAEMRLRDLASARNLALDDIFTQFEFSTAELEHRADAGRLEQLAFNLAMQDKRYLDELSQIGQQRQLENDIAFDKEMQRIVMEDNLNSLLEDIDFKAGRAVTNREYTRQLANIDIETAIDLAKSAIRDDMTRQKWTAVGNVASTAFEYAAKED